MRLIHILVVALLLTPSVNLAQEQEKPSAPPVAPPDVGVAPQIVASTPKDARAIRLQIVVSKYQGDKKISSVPFSVSLADNNIWNRIRAGARVPIPRTGDNYSYEQLGLSIDSRAVSLPNGAFQIEMNVNDASMIENDQATERTVVKSGVPAFRNMSLSSTTVLKDGQTSLLSTATDPISGIGMRIDVTVNAAK